MENNWIISLGAGENAYKTGYVTYLVTSHFAKSGEDNRQTITDKVKRFVGGDFADLTAEIDTDTIAGEYGCSAAGKEETCSQKQN